MKEGVTTKWKQKLFAKEFKNEENQFTLGLNFDVLFMHKLLSLDSLSEKLPLSLYMLKTVKVSAHHATSFLLLRGGGRI